MRNTKDRILDAAELLFAERGFDGASLRAITARAGVNLAAVNYHFSSKEALIDALFARKLGILNRRRLAMLDGFEREAGGRAVPVEKVVRALIEPVLRLAGDPAAGGVHFGMLMGRLYSGHSVRFSDLVADEMRNTAAKILSIFHRALPELPPRELYWRIFFTVGALAQTLGAPRVLEIISSGLCDLSEADAVIERLVAFAAAGIRAPVPPCCIPNMKSRGRTSRQGGPTKKQRNGYK